MFDNSIIKTNCRSCAKTTRHEITHELLIESKEDFFNEEDRWQIIRCLGCYTVAFRHRNDDLDDIEVMNDGTVQHSITEMTYPRVIANHRGLQSTFYLPLLIRKIYGQTLRALGEQAHVLASIGLRACIEAVCNELKLSAASLEKRIDQLFKAGYVSNGDKKRLHAIRFLGNDAAHEIKEPNQADIRIALEIVEHLLSSVFILEQRASRLDTVAETYDEFLELLQACVAKNRPENASSLAGLLGRQRRLVGNQFDVFEQQVKADITADKLAYLAIGPIQNVAGKDVQLYEAKLDFLPEDDDIPF